MGQVFFIIKFCGVVIPLLVALAVVFFPMSKMRVGVQKLGGLNGVEIPITLIVFIKAMTLIVCLAFSAFCAKFFFNWI
ncbi:MAG: hypothetical protein ACFBZ8_12250 [Opitutales bacterium]